MVFEDSILLGSRHIVGMNSFAVENAGARTQPSQRFDNERKAAGPPIAPELERRIREALSKPGRTQGVRKIAERFGAVT